MELDYNFTMCWRILALITPSFQEDRFFVKRAQHGDTDFAQKLARWDLDNYRPYTKKDRMDWRTTCFRHGARFNVAHAGTSEVSSLQCLMLFKSKKTINYPTTWPLASSLHNSSVHSETLYNTVLHLWWIISVHIRIKSLDSW